MGRRFEVRRLGECRIDNPLRVPRYVSDEERVLLVPLVEEARKWITKGEEPPSFEVAGPRRRIYFDPSKVRAAVVTCGGLCPGLNDVIRALVLELAERYRVASIYGIRYGYRGFIPSYSLEPMELTPQLVEDIHEHGGTILGSSRGQQPTDQIVDALERMGISQLYCIGGDGTLRGAKEIAEEALRRGLKIAVVGIPKTIDNDICYVERTFGFDTAFSVAREAVAAAHNEAEGAPNGIGLVKLMGRESGYIAAQAALAMNDVDFVLVPEVPFELEGPCGLFDCLEKRLAAEGHAVVLVAEGAGQDLIRRRTGEATVERDPSGNVIFRDIGIFLKKEIKSNFDARGMKVNIKYIDPSYMIRSCAADATDSAYCIQLAQAACHAAMCGRTSIVVGRWCGRFTHVPLEAAVSRRNRIDPHGELWRNVVEATGQPFQMGVEIPPAGGDGV